MANYKLSVEAVKDLENIWVYTFETWSIEQADRYINQIFEEIKYISIKPKDGIDFSYVRNDYLRTKVKFHYIFYKVNKVSRGIEIIRILHQRMHIENEMR